MFPFFTSGVTAKCLAFGQHFERLDFCSSSNNRLEAAGGVDPMAAHIGCDSSVLLPSNNSAIHLCHEAGHGHRCTELSPLLDDTLTAVLHSNIGPSPLHYPSGCWHDATSNQGTSTTAMDGDGVHDASASKLLQMSHQLGQRVAAPTGAATTAAPEVVLYGNFRQQHQQAYLEADQMSLNSNVSTAAIASASHTQLGLLAAGRTLEQAQQQQQAYDSTLQQQEHVLLAEMHQHNSAAVAVVAAGKASALCDSALGMSQQHLPSTFVHQAHRSMHAPGTLAARPPIKASVNYSYHYHPYSSVGGSHMFEQQAALDGNRRHHHVYQYHHDHSGATATALQTQAAVPLHYNEIAAPTVHTASAAAGVAAAALPPSAAGRWAGAVAVLDQSEVQDSASLAHEHCSLVCDEDIRSMDSFELQTSQQAAPYGRKEATHAAAQPAFRDDAAQHRAHKLPGGAGKSHTTLVSSSRPPASHACAAAAAYALLDGVRLHDVYEDTGSTPPDSDLSDEMDEDTVPMQDQQKMTATKTTAEDTTSARAAEAALSAAQQAVATRQAVALRVVNSVANRRKGEEVLTAHPSIAEAAGAESVRPRLLVTEVSLYCDSATASAMAMEQSNKLMSRMKLPDGVAYMPVHTESFLFKAACAWQFPAFAICLGSSYLQRMLVKLPHLASAALACPGFEDYCRYLPNAAADRPPRLTGGLALETASTLRSILFTCLFIATKVADQVHALGLLRFILTNLSVNGMVVSLQQAVDIEARCLEALDWRLGPFFTEDELAGEDLELWAAAMGHWDYGTAADAAMLAY